MGHHSKDFQPIIAELKAQGWAVELTTKSHLRATPPDPEKQIVHFSQSHDRHALKNVLRDLRQSGFVWPAPQRSALGLALLQAGVTRGVDPVVEGPKVDLTADEVREMTAPLPPKRPTFEALSKEFEEPGAMNVFKSPASVTEPAERSMDAVFQELKEAKHYYSLTDEHLLECKRILEAAQKAFEVAEAERQRAAEALKLKKATFDEVFSAA